MFHLRALVWLAVAAVLTEEDEQVSSRVASACSCPVMVIKKPRDDAGAFLTVLPRRVFIHIDGTFEANEAFEWAAKHLLAPELDEVFLLTSSKYKAGGGWLGLGRGQRISQQGRDAERMAIDSIADAFQDECIRQGYNASKVPVGAGAVSFVQDEGRAIVTLARHRLRVCGTPSLLGRLPRGV